MMWIMILTVIGLNGSVSVTSQEFSYENNCNYAASAHKAKLQGKVQYVEVSCTAK